MAAEIKTLEQLIQEAEKALQGAFSQDEPLTGEGANRFLNLDELKKQYSSEVTRETIAQDFTQLAKSIRKMRSSYLPIDFFKGLDDLLTADITDNVSEMESYENTFMRMLGMPVVGNNSIASAEIESAENIKIMNINTGVSEEVSYTKVLDILDQRQQKRDLRRILINNAIYNIEDFTDEEQVDGESSTDQLFDLISGDLASPSEEDRTADPKIKYIENDLYKFSYLLIPPIQDGRISGCINEPEKIVAAPFSNVRARQINNNQAKPTLLESIIRIRLDKVSGTDTFTSDEEDNLADPNIEINIGNKTESVEVNSNSFGVLEALFILRLRSALGGLAKKLFKDIDDLLSELQKLRLQPIKSDAEPNPNEAGYELGALSDAESESDEVLGDLIDGNKLELLQQQKLIEDSIMTLLGDNSEVLNLQVQTQRNNSIHNSHLMSGIIDVVRLPGKRIDQEIKEIQISKYTAGGEIVDGLCSSIGTCLGTDIGIGTVDIIVFALALFTIEERYLLGLLNEDQFDKLKNGDFKHLLPEEGDREDGLIAINALTDLIISAYKVFVDDLTDDQR